MCNVSELQDKRSGCLAMVALICVKGSARIVPVEGTCMTRMGALGLSDVSIEHKLKGRWPRRFTRWQGRLAQADLIIGRHFHRVMSLGRISTIPSTGATCHSVGKGPEWGMKGRPASTGE